MERMTRLERMDGMALLVGMPSVTATRGSTVTAGTEHSESERFSPYLQRE